MLILSRRAGESIYVGGDIRFTILKMQGRQVKIGLEAVSYTHLTLPTS